MATTFGSYHDRAEHYRRLASLISDEVTHRLLLTMAREQDEEDISAKPIVQPRSEPQPRNLS